MAAAGARTAHPAPSDEELLQRIEEGDRKAFDVLYERYLPRVYKFVSRRLNNRADVEETTQDVFIAVFSSLASFRGDAPFSAWVLGVARRTIASRFKKKVHPTVPLDTDDEPEVLDLLPGMLQREPSPLEHYECRERLELLQEAAELRLTVEQRRLFELHHLRHLTIQDIARVLRKSEDAVKSHLYRARRVLLARP